VPDEKMKYGRKSRAATDFIALQMRSMGASLNGQSAMFPPFSYDNLDTLGIGTYLVMVSYPHGLHNF
jgi:hypothetical protein